LQLHYCCHHHYHHHHLVVPLCNRCFGQGLDQEGKQLHMHVQYGQHMADQLHM